MTILSLNNRSFTFTQTRQQCLAFGFYRLTGKIDSQLLTDTRRNLGKRQQRRFAMLFNAQNHHCLWIKLNRAAIGRILQHFLTKCSLNDLPISGHANTTFAPKSGTGFHLQAVFLSRLRQVRSLKGRILKFFADFNKTRLNLLRFLEDGRPVVFVDAVSGFASIGEITVIDGDTVARQTNGSFGHEAGLPFLLSVLPAVVDNPPPRIRLVGCEGGASDGAVLDAARLSLQLALEAG
ncbi:MAG: hypothetical protein A2Z65_02505 [Gallionellales bacterium RIFCSPLOWO2_02_58_13]|nr:MAG: hypothetical protein A2Z65_02505 [Gallionellales bacterium RIFCSPLOWO2_02_58_13]